MGVFKAGSQSRRGPTHRLLERDWELAAIERVLSTARSGVGAVAWIEGEPGSGKSRLLSAGADSATRTEMRVLGARAAELERDFPFGLAIQLFEPVWLAAEPEQRSTWLSGPARRAAALFDGSITDAAAKTSGHYPIIHGLFWMTRQLEGPLALLVDDIHWADGPSIRFLAYLAERVRSLPVAIVLTTRQGDTSTDPKALAALRRASQDALLRTQPLSLEAVTTIVHRQFPGADSAFCEASARLSGGNPFLLIEFLNKLREEELTPSAATSQELAAVLPDKVVSTMADRLEATPKSARVLAQAVAVLGSASLPLGAAVAEIDDTEAARAADVLAGAGLLRPGVPLSFMHPLLREAVIATLSPLERSHLHGRVARELAGEGAGAERIAAHLLEAPPAHDPGVIAMLQEAAASALAAGRSDQAVALLERALAQQPSEELRATLALARSDVLCEQGRHAEATELLGDELLRGRVEDAHLQDELDAAYVSAAALAPGGHRVSRPVRERLLAAFPAAPSQRQRRALARSLVYESLLGAPRANVRRLADVAWAEGELLTDQADGGLGWPLVSASLLLVDDLERVVELSEAFLGRQVTEDGVLPHSVVQLCRAWALAEQGRLTEAAVDATAALAGPAARRPAYTSFALATLGRCHIERGELEEADAALDRLGRAPLPEPIRQAVLLELRARLRLAQHRPEQAMSDVSLAATALQAEFGTVSPGAVPVRSTAALAHLALGQPDEARRLAEEELTEARRVAATRAVIRALRVLGLATGGQDGLEHLIEAVELGAASPLRLEYIHALIDLGAALRRTNRRSDAREPLRRGLELAEQGGVRALVRRARTELLATSSRPELLTMSGPESLTASQRRVAELAVRGLTTREIAEALFVRPKTVEFHLRQIYRKLDITSRDQLADALHTAESADEHPDENR